MSFHSDVASGVLNALDNQKLRLILMPTEKCNFRCTYCYEDFELGEMSPAVVDAICSLLDHRKDGLQSLEIDWFGGEPLLAPRVIERVCEHAVEVSAGRFRYRSSMTTNAYLLTVARLEQLVDLGVRSYQVSLDGWGATHDRTRQRKGGGPSFQTIWQNLLDVRASELSFKMSLRVHFSPDNVAELPRLLDEINAQFGTDSRFSVFFKAVGRYGGPNDASTTVFSGPQQATLHAQLTARLGSRIRSTHVGKAPAYVCYASQPNSLVVRADGALAKCTVALDDPRNKVGRIRPDGTLSVENGVLQRWFIGLERMDAATLACPLDAVTRTPPLSPPRQADARVRLNVVP